MKTKALISFAVTANLICVFVFAYAKSRFSHDAAQITCLSVLETVQSDIARLHVLADRETPMSTDGNDKSSINTSISEFQQLKYRLDILESVTENHGSAISHLEILEHSITLTNENLISHGIILAALNDSVMQLKALSIELSNSSKTGGTKLSQLEADINSFDAIIQELASGTNDFDANRTADLPLNVRLMTVISNMEANLTLATQMIKTQGDTIQAINETVVHMGTVTSKANSSSVVDAEILLADLEEKIESRLLQIELDVEMGKSENLSSNLIDLKLEIGILKIENQDHHDRLDMQIGTINEAIQNNDAGINDNSDKIRLLNETITANVGNAQNFESNITDLERDIGTVKAAIQNNYNEIASSFEDIEELNKSTSDSLSQLATRLTEGTGNHFILKVADECSSGYDDIFIVF